MGPLHMKPHSFLMGQLVGSILLLLAISSTALSDAAALKGPERTLALVKPDAVRLGYAPDIKRDIEAAGFSIVAEREMLLSPEFVERFYAEHAGQHFYPDLVEFMSSGRTLAMVLDRPDAVAAWRAMMGPTNSAVARSKAPDSIRAKYGTDGRQNAVHGSESVARAKEEIQMVFEELQEGSANGLLANMLAGMSAAAVGVYGLRMVSLRWPSRGRTQTQVQSKLS